MSIADTFDKTENLLLVNKDYSLDANGKLEIDISVATRCLIRLLARRGEWWYKPDFGSRIHTIRSQPDADSNMLDYCNEALADMIGGNEIDSVEIIAVEWDNRMSALSAELLINLSDERTISILGLAVGS